MSEAITPEVLCSVDLDEHHCKIAVSGHHHMFENRLAVHPCWKCGRNFVRDGDEVVEVVDALKQHPRPPFVDSFFGPR